MMTTTSDLGQKARDHAQDLGSKVKTEVQNEATAKATQAKSAAASKVQGAADAASAAADKLDPTSTQAQAIQQVADQIEDVAAKLRGTDVSALARQATDVARANPMLFIGGAAIAGFAAARFLKARDPHRPVTMSGIDPWTGSHESAHTSVVAEINGERDHA